MTQPSTSPFIHTAPSLPRLMWQVCASLSLGIAVHVYNHGSAMAFKLAFAVLCAISLEALCLALRRYSLKPALDGSAALTALLLTLALPDNASYGLILTATALAIVLAKQLFGGLGMNPFNPAMVAYALCLVSFPVLMSQHQSALLDGTTGATLLDSTRTMRSQSLPLNTAPFAWLPVVLENIAWLLGWFWLWTKRFVDARITLAMLLSAMLTALAFWLYDSTRYLSPVAHLLHGALIFGACFIATDPTTAATTKRGRYLYGAVIGVVAVCIRNVGQYPDGVAFAVLFGNALVPLLDPFTQPKYR